MTTVEYSKCKNCDKIQHVSELQENSEGIGHICINVEECKARTESKSKPGL